MQSSKQKGYQGESLAVDYLLAQGWRILGQNFAIAGGEIDIIAENEEERVFVEVKVVPADIELTDYISSAKIAAMTRTAETYNLRYPTDLLLRLDAIFVTDGSIREHFEHISFYL